MQSHELIHKHNEEQLNILEFALGGREQGTFGVVIYEHKHYTEKLYELITKKSPQYQHIPLDVNPFEITSLHRFLKEYLPAEINQSTRVRHVIHIFNLSGSLITYDRKQDKIIPSRMLDQLNFERELLFRDLPYIVLVWLDKSTSITFHRKAPDLWDWITYIFEFKTPEEEKIYHGEAYSAPLSEKKEVDPQVLELIEYLKGRLEKVDPNQPEKRVWKDQSTIRYLLAEQLVKAARYREALENLLWVLPHVENLNANDQGKADLYLKIGSAYFLNENDDTALEFFNKILTLPLPQRWYQQAYLSKGAVYENNNDFETAQKFFQKAIDLIEETDNLTDIGQAFFKLAHNYHKSRYWEKALIHYQKALDCFIKEGNKTEIKKTYQHISQAYKEQGRTELAELFAQKGSEV
ncbi:MAG: tetratricopeptide repeat protein [Microscillaceae bacterium]|nr:tetratricopeptide repeat protein [Microscillaceae bacterium]